jgi:hypothetical protein
VCFSALGFRGISPLVGGNLVGDQPIQDVRGLLDRIARRAARLQTLDRGAPVSTYTVAFELGHESEAMVRRVYAHLGEIRHRAEVVEYRVGQHLDQIRERLRRLGIVTGNVTAASAGSEKELPRDTPYVSGAESSDEWAWVELNYRPHAYQACAPNLSIRNQAVVGSNPWRTRSASCPQRPQDLIRVLADVEIVHLGCGRA